MKRCRVCRTPFTAYNSTDRYCSGDCAIKWLNSNPGKKAHEKAKRQQHRKDKERVRGLPEQHKLTQPVVNQYVRLRDDDKPCFVCGKHDYELRDPDGTGKWHAAHYRSVGSTPELRYNTLNIRKTCIDCNVFDPSHKERYGKRIKQVYGESMLDWLDGPHEPKHYDIEYLKRMRKVFRKKINRMKERRGIAN